MFKGAVIGSFRIVRKTASRKFAGSYMVAYAFATIPLAGTGFIAAITGLKILFGFTFHHFLLSNIRKGCKKWILYHGNTEKKIIKFRAFRLLFFFVMIIFSLTNIENIKEIVLG
jgi:hypothetical protein